MLNKIWFQKECTQILNVEQMRAMKELHHFKGNLCGVDSYRFAAYGANGYGMLSLLYF